MYLVQFCVRFFAITKNGVNLETVICKSTISEGLTPPVYALDKPKLILTLGDQSVEILAHDTFRACHLGDLYLSTPQTAFQGSDLGRVGLHSVGILQERRDFGLKPAAFCLELTNLTFQVPQIPSLASHRLDQIILPASGDVASTFGDVHAGGVLGELTLLDADAAPKIPKIWIWLKAKIWDPQDPREDPDPAGS
eukprot:jgi/Phyca11/15300/fgenesh1_pg.PHYCAscaffold_12_\